METWLRYKMVIIFNTLLIIGVVLSLSTDNFTYMFIPVSFPIVFIAFTINPEFNDMVNYKIIDLNHNYINGKYFTIVSYQLMIADGEISDKEKIFFHDWLRNEFGYNANTKYYIKNFETIQNQGVTLKIACNELTKKLPGSGKIQLLHYYISLITVDKFLSVGEIALLRKICKYSRIHYRTLDAVLAMFNYTSEEDLNRKTYAKTYSVNSIKKHYTILELDETASENEIKSAYRRLVKIYHPDKQKSTSELAKQKFQAVQDAYEKVKKHKGFN